MNPKHAEIDRSLMLRKVQGYLVEIGDHVVRTFGAERHAEAWEYVAEKAEAKLRGPVLRQLYNDIVARNQNGDREEGKNEYKKDEDAYGQDGPGINITENGLNSLRWRQSKAAATTRRHALPCSVFQMKLSRSGRNVC